MNTPTVLTPNPAGLITVTAGYTPTANIHEPDSTYAQFYILPTVGPLSYLAWQRLNMWLPADDTTPIEIGHEELAWSLGAAPARLTRSISRLIKFHLAYVVPAEPDTLYVKRRAPSLNPALLAGLAIKCPTLVTATPNNSRPTPHNQPVLTDNERAAGHPGGSIRVHDPNTAGGCSVTSRPMPIPETDLHRIRTWAANHSPAEVRSQLWVELDITNTSITVLECRPDWRGAENQPPTRDPVARCRWNNTTKRWTLYWQRRDLKFHIWPHLDPQPTIAPLLAEIDDHSNGAFWG